MVPSKLIKILKARIDWKPFEWAAKPRIAWKETGLPVMVSWSLPHVSVQAIGNSIFSSRAVMPISWANVLIVSAGMPVTSAAHSGVYSSTRSFNNWKAGLTWRPSGIVNSPSRYGSRLSSRACMGLSLLRSHQTLSCTSKHSVSWGISVCTNKPKSSLASSVLISSAELEYWTKKSRS